MKDVARMLGVSPQRVQQWIYDGRLGAVKVGVQWRISVSDVVSLAANRRDAGPVRCLSVPELSRRWRLPEACVREVIRDGWLDPVGDDLVMLAEVEDLEEMGMPRRWRERALRMERMTPPVNQDSCGRGDLAGWEP